MSFARSHQDAHARALVSSRRLLAVESLESRRLLAVDLRLMKDVNPGLSFTSLFETVEVGPITFFSGTTSDGYGLWKTDGTQAGTVQIKDFGFNADDPASRTNQRQRHHFLCAV